MNKFNIKELLVFLQENKVCAPMLRTLDIVDINGLEKALVAANMKADERGCYTKASIKVCFIGYLRKHSLKNEKLGQESQAIQPFDYIANLDLGSRQVKKFISLTLTKKFKRKIEAIRVMYDIPKDGFNLEGNEYKEWFGSDIAGEDCTSPESYQSLVIWVANKIHNSKSTKNYDNHVRFLRALGSFSKVCTTNVMGDIYSKYQDYMIWGFNLRLPNSVTLKIGDNKLDVKRLITTTMKNDSKYKGLMEVSAKSGALSIVNGWIQPSSNYFLIAVKDAVPITMVAGLLKENKEVYDKRIMEFYKASADAEQFRRDFIIYQYRELKTSYKDIVDILKKKYGCDITTEGARTANSIFRKQIRKLEKV